MLTFPSTPNIYLRVETQMSPVVQTRIITVCGALTFWFCANASVYSAPAGSSNECDIMPLAEATVSALWTRLGCHESGGDRGGAVAALEELERRYADGGSDRRRLEVLGRLGAAYLDDRDYVRANQTLSSAVDSAAAYPASAAPALNDLGRLYMAIDRPLFALAAFDDALRLAPADEHTLRASVGINLARVLIDVGDVGATGRVMASLVDSIDAIGDPSSRARHRLMLGTMYRDAQVGLAAPATWRSRAQSAFSAALQDAKSTNDALLQSYALGFTGRLYEDERRWDPALRYSREAALIAQQIEADELLYRWQWQTARILRSQGQYEPALAVYELATDTLAYVRPAVAERSHRSFRQDVEPLYFEYADLLLANTSRLASTAAVQRNLVMARDALEQLKVAEIEDYFDDECAVNEDRAQIEQMSANAAVLYPVVLPDRIELLLSLPGELTQTTVRVPETTLNRFATRLRLSLEDPSSGDDYRSYAEAIYGWIIRPVEAALSRSSIDTLVVVPGGVLRTIPIGALHDGEQFLIERHAVATSPGLTLTGSAKTSANADAYVQINGLTETVAGFPALPHVTEEIASIAALYRGDVNSDAAFSAARVETELAEKPYDFVHIATHGQFHSDPRRSFLLTHDELITMDRLESILGLRRYVSEPVDLLFLSACQTAAGDDRAALGLAGAAVRSGADSVVASLWLINDESTARLVAEFYRNLRAGNVNKAQALQRAQLMLLRDARYAHPNYWAAFLLLGNWL